MKEQAKTPVFQEDNGTWAHLTKLVNPLICTIDLEQREGRIIRQGNHNKKVHIFRYVTESTFDSYMWVRHEVA